MTEEISFPPLFEVPPRQIEAQKQHLLSAIASEPEHRRLALPTLPGLRLPATNRGRFVGIAAVAGAAAVIGVFAAPGTSSHHTATGGGPPQHPVTVATADAPGGPIPLSQALSSASKSFGVPIILPDTPLLKPSDAGASASEELLPSPQPGVKEPVSQVVVEFPSPYVSISYSPTALTSGASQYPNALDQYQAEIAQSAHPEDDQIVHLSDGTPALISLGPSGNAIEFRVGKLSIAIWAPNTNGTPTTVDASAIQALAQSIVDQAATANHG